MLLDLLTVVVLAWVGSRLAVSARESLRPASRARVARVVRGLRPRHFVGAIGVLALVLVAAVALLQVRVLQFGWWTAIGGEGNPAVGITSRARGPLQWLVPLVFLALLVPALPLLVLREEQAFRAGSEYRTFWQRLGRGVVFGLVHAVIGIPIGAAIALSIGGWYFTWRYLRGYRWGGPTSALLESARAHLAYDLVVLALVAVAVLAGI